MTYPRGKHPANAAEFHRLCFESISRLARGADPDHWYYSIVGSFGDTMDDDWCIREMSRWIECQDLGQDYSSDFTILVQAEPS